MMVDGMAVAQSPMVAEPQPAIEIIDHAVHQARKAHKPMLVVFQSSWSDVCKQLDSTLFLTAAKNIFEKYFVITRITVQGQSAANDSLANPGGTVMMKAFAGGEPMLPFCVFFNKRGRKIADTNVPAEQPAENFSAAKNNLDALLRAIQQCAPRIPNAQLRSLMQYFHRPLSP